MSLRRMSLVVVVACAVALPAAGAKASGPAATPCPSGGQGGPFLRICSNTLSMTPPVESYTTVGAYGGVTLPCSTRDLKARKYYDNGGHVIGVTTDEGYVYFATYAPGDEEVEVGYFHNPNLPYNGYTLYVRHHKSFWNQSPSEATPCGTTIAIQYLIQYQPINGPVYGLYVQSAPNRGRGHNYWFFPKPGKNTMYAQENPAFGSPPSGKGSVAVLTQPGWQNACSQCAVGMLTAIAQNIPGGVPTNPLEDGAAFGPVTWKGVFLDDHLHPVSWTTATTSSTIVWKPGITTATKTSAPPDYTVSTVQVPCIASTSGNDRWTCS